MTLEEIDQAISDAAAEMNAKLEALTAQLDTQIATAQRELYTRLLQDFVGDLELKDGKLAITTANLTRVAQIDALLDTFRAEVLDSVLSDFAQDLLSMRTVAANYYKSTGFAAEVINKIQADMSFIEARIGIDKAGNFTQGGYLDTLAQTPELRQQLKNTIQQAMSANRSLKDFKKGLAEAVQGATGQNGYLQSYFYRYAHDTYNQIYEISNKHFADSLGLTWFIYQGSLIKTSRAFCIKKAGKVFNTAETEAWRDDVDLLGKASKASYHPLLERGRWSCRHFIAYISEALARFKAPEKFMEGKKFLPNLKVLRN